MHYLPHSALAVAVAALIADLIWAYRDRTEPAPENVTAVQAHARRHRTRLIIAAAAAVISISILLIWAPWWIEGHRLKDDKLVAPAGIIITGFRTMIIALIVGALTVVGLYYTREKHQLEREQFQHAQQQFAENQKQFETTLRETQQRDERQAELTREGQVTGRYVEAINLLGSDSPTQRLGGIYALERIMRDSEKDHQTIVEVLAAFIRHRAPSRNEYRPPVSEDEPAPKPADDVQAALTVLRRRPARWEAFRIDLRHACLAGADLSGSSLERPNWTGTLFQDADLSHALLNSAFLRGAQFQRAILHWTQLRSVKMSSAQLQGADLAHANLENAEIGQADLTGTKLETVDNLLKWRLLQTKLSSSTELHSDLARDPKIIAHIIECEKPWPAFPQPLAPTGSPTNGPTPQGQ
ncbi:pentapeptide repeat-containing protein [Streptomyces sp. NPDC001815]|uniref:pentapeptide repeat-containing protein n=1 Tax=Streptomyces sp. NPDC001815 TaxID=3154526 RepID=UPI00331C5D10